MKFWSVVLLFFILGCDTVTEEYLYTDKDPEHAILLAMQAAECVNDAEIFDRLEVAGQFETNGMLNKIFKISQDTQNQREIYVKVTAVTASDMTLVFNSSENSLDKIVTFELTDHDSIMSELKIMACNTQYDKYFSASGLGNTDSMKLTWEKLTINEEDGDDADDDPDRYDERKDTYTFDNDYPLFFFYYNATKVRTSKLDEDEDEKTSTSVITITEVTDEDECDEDEDDYNNNCEFDTVTRNCGITVNTGLYASNAFSDEIISANGDADCDLLDSANL